MVPRSPRLAEVVLVVGVWEQVAVCVDLQRPPRRHTNVDVAARVVVLDVDVVVIAEAYVAEARAIAVSEVDVQPR